MIRFLFVPRQILASRFLSKLKFAYYVKWKSTYHNVSLDVYGIDNTTRANGCT